MPEAEITEGGSPETDFEMPEVVFQFSPHQNSRNAESDYQAKVLHGDIDIHPWINTELMTRLKQIKPRTLSIDGVIPGFKPAGDDGKSIAGKIDRLKDNSHPNSAWAWYLQPGRPSEYANIDVNRRDRDYMFNVSADITDDTDDIFRYLISNKELAGLFLHNFVEDEGSLNFSDLNGSEKSALDDNLKRLFYTTAVLTGLTTGVLPNILENRSISRRSFLRGAGRAIGALTLSTILSGLSGSSRLPLSIDEDPLAIINQLKKSIATTNSLQESIEIQKILENSYAQLSEDQPPQIIRAQGRTAMVKEKNGEALQVLHNKGIPWEDLLPSVLLFGSAHSLEANKILESRMESDKVIKRYGRYILGGMTRFNNELSISTSDRLRSLAMNSDQLTKLKLAIVDVLSLTTVQRVYDPASVTIHDDWESKGSGIYEPYNLLVQPEESFISENVKQSLVPIVSETDEM